MIEIKCSTFLLPAKMHISHLWRMEIRTFWNTPGMSQISPTDNEILTTSVLSIGISSGMLVFRGLSNALYQYFKILIFW